VPRINCHGIFVATMADSLRELRANGVRYAYLERGSGPLVLLLHGYPDNARSWTHQLSALASAGYRAVAPFLRGYPPTEVPRDGFFDRATLALDMKCLLDELDDGEPAFLVGQDWGAAISYGILGAFGDRIRRAVILAVPHPVQIKRTLRRSPKHVIRSFHWFLFQLPWLPERLLRARDHAFIEFLWWLWSPRYLDHAHVAEIKRMMAEPFVVEATLAYYRSMVRPALQDPAEHLRVIRATLDRPIDVPTRVLCGSRDMRKEMLPGQRDLFRGPFEWAIVEGAGHFLHRERPREVNASILEWLAAE
jgi:pimeloyl-ACP methyl ester carboxylesterase